MEEDWCIVCHEEGYFYHVNERGELVCVCDDCPLNDYLIYKEDDDKNEMGRN